LRSFAILNMQTTFAGTEHARVHPPGLIHFPTSLISLGRNPTSGSVSAEDDSGSPFDHLRFGRATSSGGGPGRVPLRVCPFYAPVQSRTVADVDETRVTILAPFRTAAQSGDAIFQRWTHILQRLGRRMFFSWVEVIRFSFTRQGRERRFLCRR
jgi:hypothetical protein